MFGLTLTELRFAGYALLLAACLGGYMWWHHSIYTEGAESTETKYVQRDAKAAQAARNRIAALEAEARGRVAAHASAVATITTKLRSENAAELVKKDNVINGLRDGTARLYVSLASPATGCGGTPSATTGTTPGTDGARNTGYLGADDATVLVTEFARSDDRARKVSALQALVMDQIRTCNQ